MNQAAAAPDCRLCSRDVDDETLVACMDLVRMGLAAERAGEHNEVYFYNLAQP
jgi:hypothetical protein